MGARRKFPMADQFREAAKMIVLSAKMSANPNESQFVRSLDLGAKKPGARGADRARGGAVNLAREHESSECDPMPDSRRSLGR